MPVFHDRLSSLLEQHLNKTDRRLYVREAFQAFLTTDCESFMQGKVATTCQDIGLFRVQYQALRLAFAGLSSDGRYPDVADVYLSQGAETLLAVLERAEPIYPGGFYRQCSILRKWLLKPPSRWEVWSDLEPGLQ
jgi:hypothetical protein